MATQLAISANPLRMAQFSYNLVASVIMGIIPLSIRLGKNPRDLDAGREMLAMFNNKLYQAREAYYASITLGMVQVRLLWLKRRMSLPQHAHNVFCFFLNRPGKML